MFLLQRARVEEEKGTLVTNYSSSHRAFSPPALFLLLLLLMLLLYPLLPPSNCLFTSTLSRQDVTLWS